MIHLKTRHLLLLCLSGVFFFSFKANDFLTQQKQFSRVKEAYKEKGESITNNLLRKGIKLKSLQVIFIAYKEEQQLEVWAKNKEDNKYALFSTYNICEKSGTLGPKRKKGDGQVPEGFYQINRYNPSSSFYLSLGLNYPNASDKVISKAADLGGDIFIHGSCVTIGCMPMTDDKIKEIYLLAIEAHQNGQSIPVYSFPFRMTNESLDKHLSYTQNNKALLSLWNNLKTGYDKFQKNHNTLEYSVDKEGRYQFK